jgi:hypothetical protein
MVGSQLEGAELRGALRDLILLADEVVAKKQEQLQALRSSHSDQNAITALTREIDRLSLSADQLRPLTN